MTTDKTPITATKVPINKRLAMLPKHVGARRMLLMERRVYDFAGGFCKEYAQKSNGFWDYYELSNGGFYMAPEFPGLNVVNVQSHGYNGPLSPDALGIVCCLFSYGALLSNDDTDEKLYEHYHWLRYFASEHAERSAVLYMID